MMDVRPQLEVSCDLQIHIYHVQLSLYESRVVKAEHKPREKT